MQVFVVRITLIALSISAVFGIHCYNCNSHFDPRCSDPFEGFDMGRVDCVEKPNVNLNETATFCRKVRQKVNDEVRVIRTCGFISDVDHRQAKCRRTSPSKGVEIFSCECRDDFCNGSQQNYANLLSLTIAMLICVVSGRAFM